jgi:AcrR family transcriptional regulator
MSAAKRPRQTRDPEATKVRILVAAEKEFAQNGLSGARVDAIAAEAKTNKRMLYHYFGNKDDLFAITVENAYAKFRAEEAALHLENEEPLAAVRKLVTFIWDYFIANPEFITLVNSENLHKARHLKKSKRTPEMSRAFVSRMSSLLKRGEKTGLFRKGLDPVQVQISIAAIGYYYLTNRHTGSIIFERDMMAKSALTERLRFNTETVLRMLCTAPTIAKLEQQGSVT